MAKLDFPDASYSPWVAPNNVIYTYIGTSPNGYWEANTANTATNLTAIFVERTGSTMTGALKLDNAASVSLPDISFDGDVNTGLYSPGADSLAIVTGGSQRVTVDSSGNVGIGTSSADANLHIKGSYPTVHIERDHATNYSRLLLDNTSNDGGAIDGIGDGAGGLRISTSAAGTITERMRIDSSGRVLVGTNSAQIVPTPSIFQVSGDSFATSSIRQTRFSSGVPGPSIILAHARGSEASNESLNNNDEFGKIRFHGHDGVDFTNFGAEISAYVDGTPGENDMPGRLVFSTTADGVMVPEERMRIDSSGNVGINNSSPGSYNSDGRNLVVGSGSGGQGLSIASGTSNYGTIYFANGTSGDARYSGSILYNHASDFMRFDTAAGERMRIDSSGNVLIGGTTASSADIALNANGSASFKGSVESTVENAYSFRTNGGGLYANGSTGVSLYITDGGNYPAGVWNDDNDGKLKLGNSVSNVYTITLDGNDGTATFSGTVTSSNITAFKSRMATAVTAATTLATLKQAILDAIGDL